MKHFTIVCLGLISYLMVSSRITAQVRFMEVTSPEEMEEAREKAKDTGLMLFVDVYATWCGPCKIMDKEVYTDPEVAKYMNAEFVNVRMDGETDYGRKYAAEQQLQGYPSMFIFSPGGHRIREILGYTAADELVSSLKSMKKNYELVIRYREEYESGSIEPGEFAAYISAVRHMGNDMEAERLALEYRKNMRGSKLSDADLQVLSRTLDLGDPLWDDFSEDQDRLREVLGEDYMLAMEKIYNNTLVRAVEEENIALISKLANQLSPMIHSRETNSWDLRSLPFIQYYYYTDQLDALADYVDDRFATDRKGDHRWLYGAASQLIDMDQQYRTEALLKEAEKWLAASIRLEEHFDYYFYHGMVLYFMDRHAEAKDSFLAAKKLASNEEDTEMIRQVLDYVNME